MKKIVIMLFVLLLFCTPCYAEEAEEYYDIFGMKDLEDYGDFKSMFEQAVRGDTAALLKKLDPKTLFLAEIKTSMQVMKALLMICLLNGIVSAVSLRNGKGAEFVASGVSYVLAAGLCFKVLKQVITVLSDFCTVFTGLSVTAIPLTAAVLAVSGRAVLGAGASPVLYAASALMGVAVKNIIIPCIGFYAVCEIINCLSPQGMLKRLAKLIYGFTTMGLRVCGILLGLILTFQRAVTSGTDGIAKKAVVTAVKAVPVVGDVFAAGAEGAMSVIANVKGGFAAALIMLALTVCMIPMFKILAVSLIFKVTAALSEPMGDKKISGIIDAAANAGSIAFYTVLCITLVFMASVAVLMFGMGG